LPSLVALLGPSLHNIILVFALTTWPVYARTTRGAVLSLREQGLCKLPAILAPTMVGFWRHVLPNVVSPCSCWPRSKSRA
jgi:ABC-type dipeptide/oligopeptide/nickel transport system permease subunit